MVAVALLIWELVSAGISFYLDRRDGEGRPLLQSSRARTLLPLVRNALFVVICIMAGLTILSELGVDIAPLLAGAGVVGLAIGFGAQTLVKDVITGALILFEDTVNVGDGVTINGISGGVEAISIRTIRIRDGDGTLHTIPFGQVGAVSNMTKGYSYFSADVAIGYQEDIDKVIAALREIFADLNGDPAFRPYILGDLEVSGIDRFTDTAVYLRVRIRTLPARQGAVGHEFNRRMKMKFDRLGIQLSPSQRADFASEEGPHTDAGERAPTEARMQATRSS
jgi:moderate conductance mechanosensitive channel